jgi:hypothetical protein
VNGYGSIPQGRYRRWSGACLHSLTTAALLSICPSFRTLDQRICSIRSKHGDIAGFQAGCAFPGVIYAGMACAVLKSLAGR